ncbi:hypothetical protein ACUN24_05495 [Pedobacter sp. WC2501]|uniref:hypothetical protein n=1 Tax=Pedobacter sp. WC2501 TaxID=3461400 RepID=UPI0040452C4D
MNSFSVACVGFQFYIPIQVYLHAGVDINASIEGIGSAESEARIEGKAEFEVRATLDKRNNKWPALPKFNGLTGKVWLNLARKMMLKLKTESRKKNLIINSQ